MSVEAWTVTPPYTISGTGPYQISHPYVSGAIRAYVVLDTGRLQLNGTEFAVSPEASATTGNLTLSPTVATTYAGRQLIIDRITPDEQGWIAVLGEREAGLAAQLDRMVQADQEMRARGAGALRTRTELEPFDWTEGTVPILEDGKPKSGPTATAIAAAQTRATEAAASAAAAAASAAEALAKQNSMLRDRGAWATLTLYSPSDIFTNNGTSYITQTAHIASNIAADLAAGRIRVFAAKGDAGPGTGDMLNSDNLSGLTNKPLAYTTIGGRAVGKVDLLPFSLIDPAAVITDTETLAANKVANAVPTAKAVTDYVDPQLRRLLADKTVTVSPAAQIDFTEFNNALWRYYEFEYENVKPTTNAVTFHARLSTDAGVNFNSGASDYQISGIVFSGTNSAMLGGGQTSSAMFLSNSGDVGNGAAALGVSGTSKLRFAGDASTQSRLETQITYDSQSNNINTVISGCRRVAAQDTDAIRFFFSGGNIAVGSRIRMYGLN